MSGDQHHKSKKVRYDVLFVPRDDGGRSKSIRFAPWQIYVLIAGSLVFVVTAVVILLVYTPVGTLIPIENPGLVNKYSKELISLNERMTNVMQELILLREYNVKLRNALEKGWSRQTLESLSLEVRGHRRRIPGRRKNVYRRCPISRGRRWGAQ